MTTPPKILAFAGSTRQNSLNKMMVKIAAEGAKAAGADVTVIDLRDFPMPLYDQDWADQQGFPESTLQLKALMKSHSGFLIASPEYNSSLTAVLKNTIDWVSRPEPGEAPMALSCFRDKVAVIMATSPGGLGGLRGLMHLRSILESIGTLVLTEQKTLPNAFQLFNDAGDLTDEAQQKSVQALGQKLTAFLTQLQA